MGDNNLADCTAQIVSGYVRRNQVTPDAMPLLIRTVYDSLRNLSAPVDQPAVRPSPAVPIRRSVTNEHIICLDCGWKGTMVRRHLQTKHALSPEQYRERWNLPPDYPMLAHGYSEKRSQLAKSIGLGQRGRMRTPPVAEPPVAEPPAPEPAPAPAAPSRKKRAAATPKQKTGAKTGAKTPEAPKAGAKPRRGRGAKPAETPAAAETQAAAAAEATEQPPA